MAGGKGDLAMEGGGPNDITGQIIDAAMCVHTALGPGLLESAYESCLAFELSDRGLSVQRQVELPVIYRGHRVSAGFRIDLVVEDLVVVEVKAIEQLLPVHEAQLLTYLKLSGRRIGLILNFHVSSMKNGIKRMVYG
jgi:GxxExxY protein